jgi:hypothetical protein
MEKWARGKEEVRRHRLLLTHSARVYVSGLDAGRVDPV